MTNKQILTKAIEKATANGWERPAYLTFNDNKGNFYFPIGISEDVVVSKFSIRTLLLDHDFAKALWGESPLFIDGRFTVPEQAHQLSPVKWRFHLQNMVVAEDPIQYLGEHI